MSSFSPASASATGATYLFQLPYAQTCRDDAPSALLSLTMSLSAGLPRIYNPGCSMERPPPRLLANAWVSRSCQTHNQYFTRAALTAQGR